MCGGLWWVDGFLCVGFVFGRLDCVYCMVTFILYMHKYVDCLHVLCVCITYKLCFFNGKICAWRQAAKWEVYTYSIRCVVRVCMRNLQAFWFIHLILII